MRDAIDGRGYLARVIGFYVHHHGAGHLARTIAVLRHLSSSAVLFSTLAVDPTTVPDGTRIVLLPDDRVEAHPGDDAAGGGALHWAPLGHRSLQRRAGLMVDWLRRPDAELLVCDVSVEVAVLARLCSVPTVVVRDHGARADRAHRLGYDVTTATLAPFPVELEDPGVSARERGRTWYAGLYGASSGRRLTRAEARLALGLPCGRLMVIVAGAGGTSLDMGAAAAIVRCLPNWRIVVLGPFPPGDLGGGSRVEGWVTDPFVWMCAADVVAGHGGANLVADVAAADRPFICVPEDRPHDEQRRRAALLGASAAAVVQPSWRPAERWPDLVNAATRCGSQRLHAWSCQASPARVASFLEETAHRGVAS